MTKPTVNKDPLYMLLREEKVEEFNQRKEGADVSCLQNADLRGLDLRNLDADGLDFSNSYFRNADLRGIDFRQAKLEGASLGDAHVSGCYFPKALSPEEIQMSIRLGTRLRYSSS